MSYSTMIVLVCYTFIRCTYRKLYQIQSIAPASCECKSMHTYGYKPTSLFEKQWNVCGPLAYAQDFIAERLSARQVILQCGDQI